MKTHAFMLPTEPCPMDTVAMELKGVQEASCFPLASQAAHQQPLNLH